MILYAELFTEINVVYATFYGDLTFSSVMNQAKAVLLLFRLNVKSVLFIAHVGSVYCTSLCA